MSSKVNNKLSIIEKKLSKEEIKELLKKITLQYAVIIDNEKLIGLGNKKLIHITFSADTQEDAEEFYEYTVNKNKKTFKEDKKTKKE